ncbi:MAG TPA: hypothetical protein ENJ31_07250 [Anaerolineae bacterium]|nr:hypothetical protein [Anaerolineae bacterium]
MDLPLIYDAGPRIYRYDGALPEAFVVFRARVIEDPEARLAALLDPAFDPRAEVILSRKPQRGELTATEEPGLQPTPTLLRQGPNRVIIQVKMNRAGYLVLTDTDYPGWRAMVDGEPTKILPANHAFRAVALGAGEHTVIFEYAPLSFRVGAWITAGAVLLLACQVAKSHHRDSSRRALKKSLRRTKANRKDAKGAKKEKGKH